MVTANWIVPMDPGAGETKILRDLLRRRRAARARYARCLLAADYSRPLEERDAELATAREALNRLQIEIEAALESLEEAL